MAHALRPVMVRLVDTLPALLRDDDVRHIRELIDADQVALALEWIADAVTTSGAIVDPSLRQLLVQLGTQLKIAESIKERLRV